MNTITIADIKRGGMAALDVALSSGAATIMKRNRPAAVVLTPSAYQSLLTRAATASASGGALDWMLSAANAPVPVDGGLEGQAMNERLNELKSDWIDR
jgi:PHD/YefM family antitoxin component YafN of YafNO toxin-antitoxin module